MTIDSETDFGIPANSKRQKRFSLVEFRVFLKVLSLCVLLFGIRLWAQLLGVEGQHIQELYLENPVEGALLVILVIVIPILSIGLWLGMNWGLALWLLTTLGLFGVHFLLQPLNSDTYLFAIAFGIIFLAYSASLVANYFVVFKENIKK